MARPVGHDRFPFAPLEPGAYSVVLCDPPWKFVARSAKGYGKAPPYSCMHLAEIRKLPVRMLAAPGGCMLVLWFPQYASRQAHIVMRGWGFQVKTLGAWAKRNLTDTGWAFGCGYRLRSAAEFYLLGTIGNPKQVVRDVRNLVISPLREHSRKPEQLHIDLERMFPDARRCELFARERRAGWDCWGNELEEVKKP
jgi:N6-adenosine-specific RNA methylase IME4